MKLYAIRKRNCANRNPKWLNEHGDYVFGHKGPLFFDTKEAAATHLENMKLNELCEVKGVYSYNKENICGLYPDKSWKERYLELKSEQNKVAECTLIDGYNCSLCGASQADIRKKYSNFCSNCGAKIKELKGESDE